MLVLVVLISISCGNPTPERTEGVKNARISKVAHELMVLHEDYTAYLRSRPAAAFKPSSSLVRVIADRVTIDAVASGDVEALKADLISLGMQEAVAFGRVVSGQLPIQAIPSLRGLISLNFARAASAFIQ